MDLEPGGASLPDPYLARAVRRDGYGLHRRCVARRDLIEANFHEPDLLASNPDETHPPIVGMDDGVARRFEVTLRFLFGPRRSLTDC